MMSGRDGWTMSKRAVFVFVLLIAAVSMLALNLFNISAGKKYTQAATVKSSNTLTLSSGRGAILDCNGRPLVSTEQVIQAVINPTPEAFEALSRVLTKGQMAEIFELFQSRKPFVYNVGTDKIQCEDVILFPTFHRYNTYQSAPHIIGYLDADGKTGVYAVEKAFDSLLRNTGGLQVTYFTDALGRSLEGLPPQVVDSSSKNSVTMTIDGNLQSIVQQIAKENIKAGAALLVDVQTREIKASASMPDFSPQFLGKAVAEENAPFINRAFTGYNAGSVFKLTTVAAALEKGVPQSREYTCTGSITVHGQTFKCHKLSGHGKINLQEAVQESCNTYFVDLVCQTERGGDMLLDMSMTLGFGTETTFVEGYSTAKGVLPQRASFINPAAVANFAFGQGNLLITPVQMANLLCTICAGGEMGQLSLIKEKTGEDGQRIAYPKGETRRVFSEDTAGKLMEYMKTVVEQGTGQKAKPSQTDAAGKTATAQTGILKNGREVDHVWFAGFFPYDKPKYGLVVLVEDARNGSGEAAEIFKKTADTIWSYPEYR